MLTNPVAVVVCACAVFGAAGRRGGRGGDGAAIARAGEEKGEGNEEITHFA